MYVQSPYDTSYWYYQNVSLLEQHESLQSQINRSQLEL